MSQVKSVDGLTSFRLSCEVCGGTGKLLAELRGKPGHDFAFRCLCPVGQGLASRLPSWSAEHVKKYELIGSKGRS
jgi:hypothetical protein